MMLGLMLLWSMSPAPVAEAEAMQVVPIAAPQQIELRHRDPEIDALLDRLETADAGIEDLTGFLVYTRVNVLLGDQQTRSGELKFVVVPPDAEGHNPRRVFLAHFKNFVDENHVRDEDEQWGFDGQWLYERNARQKTWAARQIAREGDDIDPLRLGEGPLPIPLGQRKAEILSRYDVSKRPVQEGLEDDEAEHFRNNVAGAVQLRLTPLGPDEQFDEVRLWYRDDEEGRLLPILARSARFGRGGDATDIAFVQLIHVRVNNGLTLKDVAVAPPGEGWNKKVEPLRENNDIAEVRP